MSSPVSSLKIEGMSGYTHSFFKKIVYLKNSLLTQKHFIGFYMLDSHKSQPSQPAQ